MRNRRNAFTLIELLVAVALLVMLTGIVVWVFTKTVKVFITADARAQIYQNVRAGLDTIVRDVMTAEPLIAADGIATAQQRLRVQDNKYTNTKWGTDYPSDTLQIWNLKSTLPSGASGSCYAKYWLDTAASQEVPILKRRVVPTTDAVNWKWDVNDPAPAVAGDTEELMQYVVGFNVEMYYTNAGNAATPATLDPYWDPEWAQNVAPNVFHCADGATLANFYVVGWDPMAATEVYSYTPPVANNVNEAIYAGGLFNISSITATTNTVYAKRAAFASALPTVLNPNGTNGRAVGALPRGFRLTLYVRDEHSNEQRVVQRVVWMPMWGS